jgi:transposase
MAGHKSSTFKRLDIVETGRRRRWSEDEKLRIVMESLSAPRLVSATARRHGISRSQLRIWQKVFRAERLGTPMEPAFVPAVIAAGPVLGADDRDTAIVVDLPTGGRLRIAASAPPALAAAVLRALR